MDKVFVILVADENNVNIRLLYVCKEEDKAKKMVEERNYNTKGLIYWYEESRLV